MRRPLAAAGLLLLLLAGCSAPEPTVQSGVSPAAGRTTAYFPVKAYLDAQAARLNQQHPAVTKRVQLHGEAPETTRVPQVDWTKELQIFYQADLNKPALRGAYAVDSNTTAAGAHLYTYTRKPGFANPVTVLRVEQDGSGVRAVSATLAQTNPLFSSQKKMELRAQNGTITSYQVKGVQKLILFDTVRYATAARVVN